ncbi:Neurexin [Globodera pallida]|nr:Neurexin [Globodera pallida]
MRQTAYAAALSAGCPFSFAADFCARTSPHGTNPCRNGGICRNVHNAHRCDCSSTAYAGPACAHKPRLVQFPLAHYAPASARLSSAAGGWHSEAEDIALTLRLSPASATASAGTGSGQLVRKVLLDMLSGHAERPESRLLLAVLGGTVAGGLLADWVFASGEEMTLHWAHNISSGTIADGNWHAAKVRRRGRSVSLFIDGHWCHHQLSNVQNPVIAVDELAVDQLAHLFQFHGELRHFTLNGFDMLKAFRPTPAAAVHGGGTKDFQRPKGVQRTEQTPQRSTTTIATATTQMDYLMTRRNVVDDGTTKYEVFSSSPSAVVQHNHHHNHNQYIHQKQQQHHQQKQKQYQKQQLYAANDSFFTKAPLGCLRQSEQQQQSCEPEPIAEDVAKLDFVAKCCFSD